ncbi:hypothetical protein [Acidisphaera sp. L21]|uniref:hypothetical protein n=1 Tax=Acidisphaera sp. L21 TaxID=1641851 RepID=UPI00131C3250|nr:hypothetical protein [Acidisphaera sp. L21]
MNMKMPTKLIVVALGAIALAGCVTSTPTPVAAPPVIVQTPAATTPPSVVVTPRAY